MLKLHRFQLTLHSSSLNGDLFKDNIDISEIQPPTPSLDRSIEVIQVRSQMLGPNLSYFNTGGRDMNVKITPQDWSSQGSFKVSKIK